MDGRGSERSDGTDDADGGREPVVVLAPAEADVPDLDRWRLATAHSADEAVRTLSNLDADLMVVVHDPPSVRVTEALESIDPAGETVRSLAVVPDEAVARRTLESGATEVYRTNGASPDPAVLANRIERLAANRTGGERGTDPPRAAAGSTTADGTTAGTGYSVDGEETAEDGLARLIEVTRRLMAAETTDAVLAETSEAAAEVLGFPGTGVRRYDPEEDRLVSVALGSTVTDIDDRPTYDVSGTPHGRAFETGETVVEDVDPGSDDPYDREPFVQVMYVPIGDWGVLSAGRTARRFGAAEVRLAELLAATSEAALERTSRREELTRYREVLDAVAGMVFAIDDRGRFTLVTDPFADELGYDREALLGRHVSEALSAADPDRAARLYEELLAAETNQTTFEGEMRRADGGSFPVEVEVSLLTDEDDEFEGAVGLVQDVTELQEARQQLREERDRFSFLFDNLPDAVVELEFVDGDPVVRSVNPTFEEMFGYDAGTVVGEQLDEYVLPADDSDDARELNRRAADGEAVQTAVRRRTARGQRHFLLRIVPYDETEDGIRSFAIYTDITTQKRREQSLQVMNRVLRHNLRNDLNVLAGYGRRIASTADDPDVVEAGEFVRETARELVDLSEGAREIQAAFASGPGDREPVDLAETVRGVAEEVRETHSDATVDVDVPADLAVDAGDRIGTVVENLVENGVVHNDDPAHVRIAASRVEDGVELRVADDGPGIPPAERAVIAEEEEITQLTHASGLGLWLVKWIVEGYGGRIAFEESDLGGTTVVVRFPGGAESSYGE